VTIGSTPGSDATRGRRRRRARADRSTEAASGAPLSGVADDAQPAITDNGGPAAVHPPPLAGRDVEVGGEDAGWPDVSEDGTPRPPLPAFAHASEAEMARILDYYRIAWEYEPHTFPILWNLEGAVTESFAPDFWLPELDLYLEMTTLRQKLVRKKNRKLRRLRELYPGIRIKLFYARDFRALLLKFGRLALAGALTGTSGQVVPVRPELDEAVVMPATGQRA
jgi:hypothetical protein